MPVAEGYRADYLGPRLEKGVCPEFSWGISLADQDRGIALVDNLGATRVRMMSDRWKDIHTAAATFNTSDQLGILDTDHAVNALTAKGIRPILCFYGTPTWSAGVADPKATPTSAAHYQEFMEFIADRYSGKCDYEMWNEQNGAGFWTGTTAQYVTRILQAGYNGVKSSDPDAKVLFGGTALNDYTFVEACYTAGAKGYFDVMAVHPYPNHAGAIEAPETQWVTGGRLDKGCYTAYREVYKSMRDNTDDKPIWFTEVGWSDTTGALGVTQANQADYLRRAFDLTRTHDPFVEVFCWYNLRNNYWASDGDTWDDRLGLLSTDFTPKPAFEAFRGLEA